MNRNQKIVLLVGLLLIFLSGLFPFYTHEYVFSLYLIQIITISILTVGLIVLFKDIVLKKNQLRNIIFAILVVVILGIFCFFIIKVYLNARPEKAPYNYSDYFK